MRLGWSKRLVTAVSLAATAWSAAGCGVSNLSFTSDTRLHFSSPASRALVRLPVTVRWEMSDFNVVPPGTLPVTSGSGYFAVFVDRSPVKPGQTLAAVADRSCRRTPGCVNGGYLADRGVYATTSDSVTIREITSTSYQSIQTHEATVVILDSVGRRIGESAWYVDFRMRKLS